VSEHGGPRGATGGFDWEQHAEDLTALSEGELKERLGPWWRRLESVSYRRQALQGWIALIRAELVCRGSVALSPEELARVLMGEQGRP
jgi:hypothetical protein